MNNKDIEKLLKEERIFKWQVAKKLGIHETTFVRWFRDELTTEQIQQIKTAIRKIKADNQGDNDYAEKKAYPVSAVGNQKQ